MSKRFGDLMAGTIAIRAGGPGPPRPFPRSRIGCPPGPQLELSGLSDGLVTAARHLVQRSTGLSGYSRDQLANDLARQVAARTAPPPPTQLPRWNTWLRWSPSAAGGSDPG